MPRPQSIQGGALGDESGGELGVALGVGHQRVVLDEGGQILGGDVGHAVLHGADPVAVVEDVAGEGAQMIDRILGGGAHLLVLGVLHHPQEQRVDAEDVRTSSLERMLRIQIEPK